MIMNTNRQFLRVIFFLGSQFFLGQFAYSQMNLQTPWAEKIDKNNVLK